MPRSKAALDLSLIGITDRHAVGMGGLEEAAREALAGGLPALMFREKDLPEEQALPLAQALRAAAAEAGAHFIVNRRLGVARAAEADGIHLGADGPTIAEARAALGGRALIGYSAHQEDEALRAFEAGADYVIFGPVFETPSKAGILKPTGVEALRRVAAAAPGPVIALGGIDAGKIGDIAAAGAAGAAAIRAIFAAASPRKAVEDLRRVWAEGRKRS